MARGAVSFNTTMAWGAISLKPVPTPWFTNSEHGWSKEGY
ncbi:hypothetical protein COLO4_23364 [Corchorus olitorius]|uniref:Uncharacterized protein n=1 Tax=Corchorus olitorius TaxID=93759 RepID=A0A1R3IH50_9ROSI|nr:hypothetical protein COLO4_23364 [Corchorus olitorius]